MFRKMPDPFCSNLQSLSPNKTTAFHAQGMITKYLLGWKHYSLNNCVQIVYISNCLLVCMGLVNMVDMATAAWKIQFETVHWK